MALPSLILFARAPRAGRVKTRLARRLSEQGAITLYEAFLEDAGRMYLRPALWTGVLWAEVDPFDPLFDPCFPAPWVREAQPPGDLGERLAAAFAREFRRGAPAAVAVGSDHPALSRRRIEEAFAELAAGHDAVVIPAEDGGYCAIGLRAGAPVEPVFRGVEWSTDAVLRQTIARFEDARVGYRVLDPGYDVDVPEDLERLRRDLERRDAADEDFPAATARALAALDGDPA